MTARNARRAPKTPTSDMTSERTEKPNINASVQMIGPWEPPAEADRALVRDGLARHGAHDLAEILGLTGPPMETGPLAVGCPTCGSAVGSACRDSGGRDRYRGTHRARLEAA